MSHRKHCSVYTIASFFPKNKYSGYLLNNEINFLEKVTLNPKRPLTAIIGGAKISSKIEVIKSLLNKVDNLIVGGGMAYTFVKSMGGNIGNSILEEEKTTVALEIIQIAKRKNVNLLIPLDSVNAKYIILKIIFQKFAYYANYMGLDISPESINLFKNV